MLASDKEIKRWLILSHGFNMDGRAASQTITDKIPHLLGAGIQLHVLSAITGIGIILLIAWFATQTNNKLNEKYR